jgi:hypothetical protein
VANALLLSPHYDDVALSCGGSVALFSERGPEPLVVTIFGGEVIDDVWGDFARSKHTRWALNNMDAGRERRQAEVAAAAATLGARTRWLGFPDAIYRGDRNAADLELYGRVRPVERPLAKLARTEIQSLPEWQSGDTTVYARLASASPDSPACLATLNSCPWPRRSNLGSKRSGACCTQLLLASEPEDWR